MELQPNNNRNNQNEFGEALGGSSVPRPSIVTVVNSSLSIDKLRQVASLYREAFSGPPWFEKWTEATAQKEIAAYLKCSAIIITAEAEGQVVGFAITQPATEQPTMLMKWPDAVSSTSLYLAEIAVLASFQNQGIAKNILSLVQATGRSSGYSSLCTRTRSDNLSAMRAFKRAGLEEIGRYRAISGGVESERRVFSGRL